MRANPKHIRQISGTIRQTNEYLFITCYHPYVVISPDYMRTYHEFTKETYESYLITFKKSIISAIVIGLLMNLSPNNSVLKAERAKLSFFSGIEKAHIAQRMIVKLCKKYADKTDELYDLLCKASQEEIKFLKEQNNMYMGG